MSIIKLTPAFKDYLWGGTKLKENYGKKTDMDPVAESWELSVHPDGPSIVASGEYEGLSFPEYLEKKGKGVLNSLDKFSNQNSFEVAIKVSKNNYGYDHEKKLATIPFYFMPFLAEDLKNGSFKVD